MNLFFGILLLGLMWVAALCMELYIVRRSILKNIARLRALHIENRVLTKLYTLPPSEFRLRWAERNLKRLNELV